VELKRHPFPVTLEPWCSAVCSVQATMVGVGVGDEGLGVRELGWVYRDRDASHGLTPEPTYYTLHHHLS
jgi:hypothetical protein